MVTAAIEQQVDEGYDHIERAVKDRVSKLTKDVSVFTTSVDPDILWETYLQGIPEERRQHYTCNCCKRFIQKYGGLVIIHPDGQKNALLWANLDGPEFFANSVQGMDRLVTKSNVNGVYLWTEQTWGTPRTPDKKRQIDWTHFYGEPAEVFKDTAVQTVDQLMADKKQDFIILERGLKEYPVAAVEQAYRVLAADAVYRSEKALGIARWLLELAKKVEKVKGPTRRQLIWLAVAKAPPGFCHIRSTMISTILADIIDGKDFEDIKRNWNLKMDPRFYQRPQAAPKEGNIKKAEEIFAKLNLADSLKRRFATLSDIQVWEWQPKTAAATAAKDNGIFGHLKQKIPPKQVELGKTTMTWAKFQKEVLPEAVSMEILIPYRGSFYGLVTAEIPESEPIFQWDNPDRRNQVSWYFHNATSYCHEWGLTSGTWVRCNGIFQIPPHWHEPEKFKHFGKAMFFALEGAKETKVGGSALFQECLRKEVKEVASVIEAHSNVTAISGDGDANGIAFGGPGNAFTIKVRTPLGTADYTLDRFD